MSAKHKSDDTFDELDRLVDRELQMLLGDRAPRRKTRPRNTASDGKTPRPAGTEASETAQQDNVIRAHPLARTPPPRQPKQPMSDLFSPEEEAFLSNAADWLAGRENADILLDALARRIEASPSEDEDWDDFLAEEATVPETEVDDWNGQLDHDEEDEDDLIQDHDSNAEDWGDHDIGTDDGDWGGIPQGDDPDPER